MTNIKIILASGSPRRKELLAQAGYDFDVCPSLSEEDLEVMAPSEYVMRLAKMKADEVCNRLIAEDVGRRVKKLPERFVVLGADTVVSLNGRILGKPYDYDDDLQNIFCQIHNFLCSAGYQKESVLFNIIYAISTILIP